MNLKDCDRNIFVDITHFKDSGGPVVAIDGDALAAFEVERSGLLQDLISTAGSAEIPLHQKAFALYQKFQHAPVHEMDELSGVIQVLSFTSSSGHAATAAVPITAIPRRNAFTCG